MCDDLTCSSISVVECWSLLQYPFEGERNGNICNIQDGVMYKSDLFFFAPEHFGLIMNVDGIKVLNSSKVTLWPVLLANISLPPHLRMNKDYRISSNSIRTSNSICPRIVSARLPVLNEIVSALD